MTLRIQTAVIDCTDPARVGRFWAQLLGAELGGPDDDGSLWIDAGEGRIELIFEPVPEVKSFKNRLHLDLRPDDQAEDVARALALGATHVDVGQGEVTWVVLADPEGNEFCILQARPMGGS